MIVYRITKEEYSKKLQASGYAARWNAKGSFVIYTAQSRALACLENLVHRSGEGDNALFKVMVIKIDDTLLIKKIEERKLKKGWQKTDNFFYTQKLTAKWLLENQSAILQVPSVLIKNEYNYLLNPQHSDFKKIKLLNIEDFIFDNRF